MSITGISSSVTSPEFNAELPLELIETHQNARNELGDLTELVASIKSDGVRQPISVIPTGDKYRLWLGHRRVAASREAGRTTIPAVICPEPTPAQYLAAQLVENLLHANMDDRDIYRACKELEALGLSRGEIGAALGKSKPSICRYLSPDKAPAAALAAFLEGKLSLGQMYAISTADDPDAKAASLLKSDVTPKKPGRMTIPLAVSTEKVNAHGTVTVASLPGKEIDLAAAETLLKQALQSVKDAQGKNWTIKLAMDNWKAASPRVSS